MPSASGYDGHAPMKSDVGPDGRVGMTTPATRAKKAPTPAARKKSAARTPGPTVFVLFGATGDLAKRMVLPAFYTLMLEGLLPADWMLVGNGRGDVSHFDFRKHVHDVLTEFGTRPKPADWKKFEKRLLFAGGGFDTDDPGSLLEVLDEAKRTVGPRAQLIHYLAVPPVAFSDLTTGLGTHGLAKGARIVYEKPFGTSPQGFRALDRVAHSVFLEQQIYRIDHFLGKEATQQLHAARFANTMFAGIWNRQHIESVQIDVPERLGIADRAGFYDATGAVLDMLVTHLFQVTAEVAMEPPATLSADDLQAAREKVIKSFRPLDPSEVVLGQFAGYRDVPGIAARSSTDTYVAARLWIDNRRWQGVPFLLRTGKRMAGAAQTVSLVLRPADGPTAALSSEPNIVTFALAGNGEVDLTLALKRPGPDFVIEQTTSRIPLSSLPDADPLPPYVRLLHDVLLGDRSLFTRPDGLSAAWKVVEPLLAARPRIAPYAQGSWGPTRARALAAPSGWILGQ